MTRLAPKTRISCLQSRTGHGIIKEGNWFMFQRIPSRWHLRIWTLCHDSATGQDVLDEEVTETKDKIVIDTLLDILLHKIDIMLAETHQACNAEPNLTMLDCGWEAVPILK